MGALAVVFMLALSGGSPREIQRTVTVERRSGELVCTLLARAEKLEEVLADLCAQAGLELEAGERELETLRSARVTATLYEQPFERVLEYALGTAGLRARSKAGALVLLDDPAHVAMRDELLQLASLAYEAALSAHPHHELAAPALVRRGRLEEARGDLDAALEHYLAVASDHPRSPAVHEALYRAGLVHARQSHWGDANLLFRRVSSSDVEHEFEAAARLELARSLVRLGDPVQASTALDRLDELYAAETEEERVERRLLRAEAELDSGRQVECLRILESTDGALLPRAKLSELHALRARAFEDLGMASEAGRAWLVHAQSAEGAERERSIERAARIALEDGDELAVLFACAQAKTPDLRERLEPLERSARAALGLPASAPFDPTDLVASVKERLDLADEMAASGDPDRAIELLEQVLVTRAELPGELRTRLARVWAVALDRISGSDAALAYLRDERRELALLEWRRELDLCAAELLEGRGRWDDAVSAYEGRY